MTHTELKDNEMEKISGGSAAECNEIVEFFRNHGYPDLDFDEDDNDLDLFLMDVLSVTDMKDYYFVTCYAPDGTNVYADADGNKLTHAQFMEALKRAYSK